MEVIKDDIEVLNEILEAKRKENKIIGFVPTMGALHKGHLSLIHKAKEESDYVVVSIFVNPLQFNNKEDFNKYPRMLESDIEILNKDGHCDLLFAPSTSTIYPSNFQFKKFNLGHLEEIMEGKYRPNHFQGVANVLYIFFKIISPQKVFFGLKDIQQIFVVKKLIELEGFNIKLYECETVREENGLAISSRNLLLSKECFNKASIIYNTLLWIKDNINNYSLEQLKKIGKEKIESVNGFKCEYIEFADAENFQIISKKEKNLSIYCCIAVYCENVRLIDNILIE